MSCFESFGGQGSDCSWNVVISLPVASRRTWPSSAWSTSCTAPRSPTRRPSWCMRRWRCPRSWMSTTSPWATSMLWVLQCLQFSGLQPIFDLLAIENSWSTRFFRDFGFDIYETNLRIKMIHIARHICSVIASLLLLVIIKGHLCYQNIQSYNYWLSSNVPLYTFIDLLKWCIPLP